ncbi:MAG: hypothetical protein LBJ09_00965 [Clostridiales bacterium]|jgi:hypothetical protein|nr:hypothetical protein [Clostridiales bacterium]
MGGIFFDERIKNFLKAHVGQPNEELKSFCYRGLMKFLMDTIYKFIELSSHFYKARSYYGARYRRIIENSNAKCYDDFLFNKTCFRVENVFKEFDHVLLICVRTLDLQQHCLFVEQENLIDNPELIDTYYRTECWVPIFEKYRSMCEKIIKMSIDILSSFQKEREVETRCMIRIPQIRETLNFWKKSDIRALHHGMTI